MYQDNAPATMAEPIFSPAALEDNFMAEQEHAEICRAEMEATASGDLARDLAASLLIESIPQKYTIALTRTQALYRHEGLGVNTTDEWSACVVYGDQPGQSICRRAATPGEAVRQVIAAFQQWRHENVTATEPAYAA